MLPPQTERLVYSKAEISWWTHHIYCENPDRTFTFPDVNLYKARVARPTEVTVPGSHRAESTGNL